MFPLEVRGEEPSLLKLRHYLNITRIKVMVDHLIKKPLTKKENTNDNEVRVE